MPIDVNDIRDVSFWHMYSMYVCLESGISLLFGSIFQIVINPLHLKWAYEVNVVITLTGADSVQCIYVVFCLSLYIIKFGRNARIDVCVVYTFMHISL